jgi:ribonuclease R
VTLRRQDVLTTLARAFDAGMRLSELVDALGGKKIEAQLRKLLDELVDQGVVDHVGRLRYAVAIASEPVAVGRIHVHPAGYGFVEREDGHGTVFVPAKFRASALDGDRVRLATWEGYKGTEGRVEEVLDRGRAKLTGVVGTTGRALYLEPDDPRIATDFGRVMLADGAGGVRLGDCVVAEITEYPTASRPRLAARILRVLGPPDDPATEIEKIIACADIPTDFPVAVMAQAETTATEVSEVDLADRIDLRDREFLTIDPETARDFDDAVCIEKGPHGPRVWVAVADVSHYVRPNDPLDREAAIRGVSVYLPERVIPMLPMQLSAGICSLNPGVDRCAMVVRLDYNAAGVVIETGFCAGVIRSRARLDYPGVAAALAGDFRGRREEYRVWADTLAELDRLAKQLRARRRDRGTLELEIPEPKVVLDADDPKLVRDVVRSKSSEGVKQAYQLVEEYMIAANEAVGGFFKSRHKTAVWRIHPPPKEERVHELAELLEGFGIAVDVDAARTPPGMRDVLAALDGKPAARALSFLVLRSLTQATYDIENVGHFGLASFEYVHFTSPIRRYPDLLVHRLLKYYLHREGQAAGGGGRYAPADDARLSELASASSSHERRAVEAEREAVALYRALLMREHLGEEFTAKVSGVTNFGVFVELDEPFVEGLIKMESLGDDRFDFDPIHMRISGQRTGFKIELGDEVVVELLDASVARRRVDFRLKSAPTMRGKPRPPQPPRKGGKRPSRSERAERRTGASKGKGKSSSGQRGRRSGGRR